MRSADDFHLNEEMERALMIQAITHQFRPQPLRAAQAVLRKVGQALHQGLSHAAEARARNLGVPAH